MAERTNEAAVRAILSTNLTTSQLDVFIKDAAHWVDEELVGSGLSDDRLELVERYLVCAFVRARDHGLKAAKYDDINEQYQVDPEVSEYLLRAAAFDTTGTVKDHFLAVKDGSASAQWRVGTRYIDELAEDTSD